MYKASSLQAKMDAAERIATMIEEKAKRVATLTVFEYQSSAKIQ